MFEKIRQESYAVKVLYVSDVLSNIIVGKM